jgi:hypothetical protein
VAAAHDVPATIHFVSPGSDDFTGNGDIRTGETEAVELQLEIALADEMSGLFVRLQVSSEVASPGRTFCPNSLRPFKWQITGSPISAVAEEKFGSSSVQRRRVPAGTRMS